MERPSTGAKLVSTSEAARELGVNQSTLSRWATKGIVQPAQRTVGGHMRWDVEKLRAQLEAAGAILPDQQ
jgi:DNA-binding transcriptional MerR regulator